MEQFAVLGIERHRMKTDGRGITTLVAVAGCPLSCRYCLNKEMLKQRKPEMLSSEELIERLAIDHCYFLYTNGGVTFGGGEALLHSAQILDFSKKCPAEWNITIETSLNIPWELLAPLLTERFSFIIDVKAMQQEIYREYTDFKNDQVIENLKRLVKQLNPEQYVIKIPLIPEYSDMPEAMESKKFLQEMGIPEENLVMFRYQKC